MKKVSMHIKSFMDVLNKVVLGHKDQLREYLNSANSKDVEEEVARYANIVDLIARTYPAIMLETLHYLVSNPDSRLFDIVIPKVFEFDLLSQVKELPAGTHVLIDKALRKGFVDKSFISAKFFNLLSTESKIKAIKLLLRNRMIRHEFAKSGIVLHINYEVFKRIRPEAFEKLEECLPLLKFDEQSLGALTAYALNSEARFIRGYLRYANHFERCVRCYNGVVRLLKCNNQFHSLTVFNPPEVCPEEK